METAITVTSGISSADEVGAIAGEPGRMARDLNKMFPNVIGNAESLAAASDELTGTPSSMDTDGDDVQSMSHAKTCRRFTSPDRYG